MTAEFFAAENIAYFRELPLEDAPVASPEKLQGLAEKIGGAESVAVFLIPYHAGRRATNLSTYAMAEDYHLYVRGLGERFGAFLKSKGKEIPFLALSDSSPFDERTLAQIAGLGVLGQNGLLLNERYGSYVFIGEFLLGKAIAPQKPLFPKACAGCGACLAACPTGAIGDPKRERCLSLLSQKKNRTPEEDALLEKFPCKWGCDLCQEACPMNRRAALSPISFFRENLIEAITPEVVEMEKAAFSRRAFSWRGRNLLRKNYGTAGEENKPKKP